MTLSPTQQRLNDQIVELADRCKLESWQVLVRDTPVPADLFPALMTGRPELMAGANPRAMTAQEVGHLYTLIGSLMETNMALRAHAEQVAGLVSNWMSQFAGLHGVAKQIDHFAHFRKIGEEDPES